MNDQREHEDLKRIAPTLFSRVPGDPFVVPDDLFERFPHEVQAAVARRPERGWTGLPVLVRRLAITLPVVAILAAAWWFLPDQRAVEGAELSTTPSLEELGWSEEHELLASVEEDDLPVLGELDVELTDAELTAYLVHENVDVTELMIEP